MATAEVMRRPRYFELREATTLRRDRITQINGILHDHKGDPEFLERDELVRERRTLQKGVVLLSAGETVRLGADERRRPLRRGRS